MLLICDKSYEHKVLNKDDNNCIKSTNTESEGLKHVEQFLNKKIYLPADENGQIVEEIDAVCIEEILDRSLAIDAVKIIDSHKKRLIPRFR